MDNEYNIMSAVDKFCNTNIEDLIAADIANQIVEYNDDDLNNSLEMTQLLEGTKPQSRGKPKNKKAIEKKTTIQKKSATTKQSTSKSCKTSSSILQTEIASDECLSSSSSNNSEINFTSFESNSQRGKARRRYLSELASKVPTVDSVDLTIQDSLQTSSVPTGRSKKQSGQPKNTRQRNKQTPVRRNPGRRQTNSNVICIGSDEEANVIYEPIKINHLHSAGTLNASYSNLDMENPEYSVKIEWLNKIEAFKLRKFQKFYDIFEILAKRENVEIAEIVLNLDNKIIQPNDTPDSIKYLCFDIINGRVVKNSKLVLKKLPAAKKDTNQISINLQSNAWKKHIAVSIKKTDSFKILYIKCSEELKLPFEKFSLRFDGENLGINETPNDLNFEDGEIVDCMVKK